MSERPICKYCGQGPFPDLKKWALHPCYTKPQIAEVIAQLRAELKASLDKLAEIEARNCENCALDYCCGSHVPCDHGPQGKFMVYFCSAHKRKDPTP